MKKLNNKGFAIASILYSIMVLFLMLLLSILGILGSRKAILDKNKKDILENLNSKYENNKFNFEHRNITIINSGNTDDIVYALMDGVTAVDENGNQISNEYISYDLDINSIENRNYTVTYTANNNGKTILGTRKITFTDDHVVSTFGYTGSEQEFIPSYNGSYKVELWGAQGGSLEPDLLGGFGAYSSGIVSLTSIEKLFLYVGGKGVGGTDLLQYEGGYNGGGRSGYHQTSGYSFSGGGATDIRLVSGGETNFDSLKSRIIVAAGGGGSASIHNQTVNPGYGGSLMGGKGTGTHNEQTAYGGTQTSGGSGYDGLVSKQGFFGVGGTGQINAGGWGGGGGSGYYGGALGYGHGGAGGSSFISGYDGCDAIAEESTEDNIIHTGKSIHYSGYRFDNAVMYAGNESMPTHDGTSTMIGNSGDGYAKISLIYFY